MRIAGRSELLAEDPVAWAVALDRRADGLLDGLVGVGDGGQVRLAGDHEVVGAEPCHRDGVCRVSETERELKVRLEGGHVSKGSGADVP